MWVKSARSEFWHKSVGQSDAQTITKCGRLLLIAKKSKKAPWWGDCCVQCAPVEVSFAAKGKL